MLCAPGNWRLGPHQVPARCQGWPSVGDTATPGRSPSWAPEPHSPLSFSPNMVRKTVKLIGPGASFTMASSSSFLTLMRPGG